MTRSWLAWFAVILGLLSRPAAASDLALPAGADSETGVLDARRTLGAPRVFRNLTLVPIYDADASLARPYITLREGLAAGSVEVREAQGGGDVNSVVVTNRSEHTLCILAGEVLEGGRQDRCVARDTLILPGAAAAVTVFCVEPGRWSDSSEFRSVAPAIAASDIRLRVQESGRRDAPLAGPAEASASREERRLERPLLAGQQDVWDRVAATNVRLHSGPAAGSYAAALRFAEGSGSSPTYPYVRALNSAIEDDPHLVGIAAYVNGKLLALDIFASPEVFRRYRSQLIRTYAADAGARAPRKGARTPRVSLDGIRALYAAASSGKEEAGSSSIYGAVRRSAGRVVDWRLPEPDSALATPVHEVLLPR